MLRGLHPTRADPAIKGNDGQRAAYIAPIPAFYARLSSENNFLRRKFKPVQKFNAKSSLSRRRAGEGLFQYLFPKRQQIGLFETSFPAYRNPKSLVKLSFSGKSSVFDFMKHDVISALSNLGSKPEMTLSSKVTQARSKNFFFHFFTSLTTTVLMKCVNKLESAGFFPRNWGRFHGNGDGFSAH